MTMKIENLKKLRATLIHSNEEIGTDWESLNINHDHYLAECLASLTISLEEMIDLVNQEIGSMM